MTRRPSSRSASEHLFPTPAPTLKSISFRKGGTATIAARTMDVQITLGITAVSAKTATTTFATNLGASPKIVLPYTNVSLPALSVNGTPNPMGWFFPFTTPFTYLIPTGNLCYEIRYKNSTTGGSFDAASGTGATQGALIGTGCTATGQTQPAAIGTRTMTLSSGAFRNQLDRAAASAPAAWLFGDTASHILLPGACSAIETLPIVTINGATNTSGTWDATLTAGSLYMIPPFTLYTQFVFLDAGLAYGVGVSNCSPMTFPINSVTRFWASGSDTALTGSKDGGFAYGLVTGFDV